MEGLRTVVVLAWDSSGNYRDQIFTLTANASKPAVTISTPSINSTVGVPVNLQASASASGDQKISGWWVYVDSKATYNGGGVKSINKTLSMSTGTHTVLVRASDTLGNYGDQTITVTVNKPTVRVTAPAAGSSVSSPFTVTASATPSSGRWITGWWVYLDGVGVYQAGTVGSIKANIPASNGTHTLVVRAWDDTGTYGDQTITVSVR
jgi:large repetitive protein